MMEYRNSINIKLNGSGPYIAGEPITGTLIFNNKLQQPITFKRIYVKFFGETIQHPQITISYQAVNPIHSRFFQQNVIIQGEESKFTLHNGIRTWSFTITPPKYLPSSINATSGQISIDYCIQATFVQSGILGMKLRHQHKIWLNPHSSTRVNLSNLPIEAENRNNKKAILSIILARGQLKRGNPFSFDIKLHNPKNDEIKHVSVHLVQKCTFSDNKKVSREFSISNIPDLSNFIGENYNETVQLKIPNILNIVPSYNEKKQADNDFEPPVSIEYVLKFKAIFRGFFKNFKVKFPVVLY